MSRRPELLPLPGISKRDPNFYEGADYQDRARFAQPVSSEAQGPLASPTTPDDEIETAPFHITR